LDFLIELIKKEPDANGPKEQTEETIMFALNMIHTGMNHSQKHTSFTSSNSAGTLLD
jgi:hypothetical protein